MEPMDTLTKPGIMAKLRNRRGFSLIEMAIVLVIIGIIIGAIIKGQDLMLNSRAKQLVSTANAWKIAAYSYMDRNGKFPGDSTIASGIIDSSATAGSTSIDLIATTMSQAPVNPVLIGGQSWYFYFGAIDTGAGLTSSMRNVMVICKNADCDQVLSSEEIELMKALDSAIDGSAGAAAGQVRGLKTLSTSALTAKGTGALGGRATGVVGLAAADVASINPAGVSSTVWSNAYVGAVWTFDKPY